MDASRYPDGCTACAEACPTQVIAVAGGGFQLDLVRCLFCNDCEADLNVLGTVVFDLGRFGVQFVASPRHADGSVVTGPLSENTRSALPERPPVSLGMGRYNERAIPEAAKPPWSHPLS